MTATKVKLDFRPGDKLRLGGIRKAVRIAINRAASPVKASVVAHAESIKRFGFLAKSIRIKTRTYPGDKIVAIIGPTSKFSRQKGKYVKGRRKGQPRRHVPAFYAHLVERGTRRSKPKPFLAPALAATGPTFLAAVPREVFREIELQLKVGPNGKPLR